MSLRGFSPVIYKTTVHYLVRGVATIEWSLARHFLDPDPHIFQLQVNRNGGFGDSWEDVGLPIENNFVGHDDTPHLYGKGSNRLLYRVTLRTPVGTYVSSPASILGSMQQREWLDAKEIIRRMLNRPKGYHRFGGFLLKRRIYGTVCHCVDPNTEEILNSDCPTCYGTGFNNGFWRANKMPMMLNMGLATRNLNRDNQMERGTVDDQATVGLCIGVPQMNRFDIWVDANSDRRYYINSVTNKAEMAQIPLLVEADLRLAPFTDTAYTVPLENC